MTNTPFHSHALLALLASLLLIGGCANLGQIYSSTRHENLGLRAGDLEAHGIAFISTSASTGREEDRQAAALLFAQVLRQRYPEVRVVTLSETLGKVNAAGLAEAYIGMYDDYRSTGLLRKEVLQQLGEATNSRYLGQLKLSAFVQESLTRFGALGLRIVNTKVARVRIYFQIWDSQTGTIAWEGVEELMRSDETAKESQVTFDSVIEESARSLVDRLPGGTESGALAPTPAPEGDESA